MKTQAVRTGGRRLLLRFDMRGCLDDEQARPLQDDADDE